jgi:hypothetical protein
MKNAMSITSICFGEGFDDFRTAELVEWFSRNERRFPPRSLPEQPFRSREEFRMPLGVRNSSKNEPASRWRGLPRLWGFEDLAVPGWAVAAVSGLSGSVRRSQAIRA